MFDYRIRIGNPERLGVTRTGRDINFAVAVKDGKECSLLLYPKGSEEPKEELSFTDEMRFGDVCAMKICGFPMEEYEYNYRIDGKETIDPYAGYVRGREQWGVCPDEAHGLRGGMASNGFAWQGDKPLKLPYEECVLYVTHPRGFTMDESSGVTYPGTFAGIREKIPYLKKLGITQLELMPAYEFAETGEEHAARKHMPLRRSGRDRINYWGYGPACFFAPKASYSASGDPVRELKELVRALHKNGIELILEFYFPPRTNPSLIMDCIRYWAAAYHIDGVHIGAQRAVLTALAMEPRLSYLKIMGESFDLEQIYGPDYSPAFRSLAEYNDDFMVKARRFLRGDEDMLWQVSESMRKNPQKTGAVNYMAGHNGFTLLDTVSYDIKHNEENGEDNRDGSNYNYSFNYGEEGPGKNRAIQKIRRRQIRNAFLLLLLSQGVPAIYGGDEMGNSQKGNNNVYCQDNDRAWIQWGRARHDRRMQRFVRDAIAFRREHPAFGRRAAYRMKDYLAKGMPDLSYHGKRAWYGDFEGCSRQIGILYAGEYTGGETLYVLYNMHTMEHDMALPTLPSGKLWHELADSGREQGVFLEKGRERLLEDQKMIKVPPRTILILEGKEHAAD